MLLLRIAIWAFQKGPSHHRAALGHLTCHEAYHFVADFGCSTHSVDKKWMD